MNFGDWLKFWLDLGYNVIPVPRGMKSPIVAWKPYQRMKYNGPYDPNGNIAVVCGTISGNLGVIDVDNRNDLQRLVSKHSHNLGDTITIVRGPHRLHLHLRSYKPISTFTFRPHLAIDIRGEGSIAILPPSIHHSGDSYELATNRTLVVINDLELWLRSMFNALGFDTKRLKLRISSIRTGVAEGQRNNAAFVYARYLLKFAKLDPNAVWNELERWNALNKPPLDQDELERTLESAISYD